MSIIPKPDGDMFYSAYLGVTSDLETIRSIDVEFLQSVYQDSLTLSSAILKTKVIRLLNPS
mgnify:CR=1 FL=1